MAKVICIYTNTSDSGRAEYAINLAAAFVSVADAKVALVDASRSSADIFKTLKPDMGIDVLTLDRIKKQHIEKIKNDYQYGIIFLPLEMDESVCEALSCADAIHFFVDSTKGNLKKGHAFLDDMRENKIVDIDSTLKFVVNRLNIFDKFSVEEMSWLLRRNVWDVVPEPGIVDTLIDKEGIPLVLRSQASEYAKVVLRIAKTEADKLLGLALGSGAAFGLAHIGVLKVLEQNHITIDVISGSSMGGLIAAMWGIGLSSDRIERIAKKLRNKLTILKLLDFTVPISSILAGKRLKRFLKGILGQKTFEDLQVPVKIMVYDLANRETLTIEKGLLVDAVYTTIAVPGILAPMVSRERLIIDGGISDPVPVDILRKQGIKKVIAVNALPGPDDIYERNMLLKKRIEEEEGLMRTGPFYTRVAILAKNFLRKIFTPNIFDVIMTSMQSTEYILAENSCRKADVVLHPVFCDATSTDFHLVRDFIKRGEEETAAHIEEIKKLAFR